ncbi:hypothetical protein [Nocardia brasiliensis]|uniref:hypothetical protein n=1 Tax=Nocardia brasiliensis TaxID=37326 RepID=UPI002456C857|nr:hypothetical protein [Nocardia brasiliensis]
MSEQAKPLGYLVGYYDEPDEAGPGAIHRFHDRWHEVYPTVDEAAPELREAQEAEPLEPWEIFALTRLDGPVTGTA